MAENERWTLGGLIEVIRADRQMSKKKRDELVAIAESIATPSAYPAVAVEPAQPVEAVDDGVMHSRTALTMLSHRLANAAPSLPRPSWISQHKAEFWTAGIESMLCRAQAEIEMIDAECRAAALAHPRPTGDSWTCFHCSETFTDRAEAALHFGTHESQHPACAIDVAAYRAMEAKEGRYFEEDADIHRQMHRMANDHQLALSRAEEAGYAKALKDTGYTAPTGEQAGEVVAYRLVSKHKAALSGAWQDGDVPDDLNESGVSKTHTIQRAYAQTRPVGVPDGWTVERGPDVLGQPSMRVVSPEGEERLFGIFAAERIARDFLMAAFPGVAEVPTP